MPPLTPEQMSDEQKSLAAEIAGPRGDILKGPFGVWLRTPELARRINELSLYLRETRALSPRIRELVILVAAEHWSAAYCFDVHAGYALREGIPQAVIDAITEGREPALESDDERLAYGVAAALIATGTINDALYADALGIFGEDGMIELVTTVGYYCLVALTLTAFAVPAPKP
jgi:4-carboxymuconolactone decarboxylase